MVGTFKIDGSLTQGEIDGYNNAVSEFTADGGGISKVSMPETFNLMQATSVLDMLGRVYSGSLTADFMRSSHLQMIAELENNPHADRIAVESLEAARCILANLENVN